MTRLTGERVWLTGWKPLALIELLGASWSFFAMGRLLFSTPGLVIPWTFLFIALSWFALVGLAGIRLFRQQSGGWFLSLVAQVLQLFQVTTGPIAFRLLAGPQLTIFFLGDRFYFFGGVTSSVNFFRGQGDPSFALGINLVSALLLVVLACQPDPPQLAHAA
jgi:hypothetical protein